MKYYSIITPVFLSVITGLFLLTCNAQKPESIKPGAYQIDAYLPFIESKNIGVVVNHTSVIDRTHLVDSLLSLDLEITKIFTPEHGFKGKTDAGASVNDDYYSEFEIPVVSLYGNKHKPTEEDLKDVDIMLFDLQDVGVRFFTYISSLHYVMEACAENHIPLLILDRPNPNGHYIDGPVLKQDFSSFVGMHSVPIVYGMTIGEYAKMINGEYWLPDSLQCDIRVIRCRNYSHAVCYSLPVAPSPNLNNMAAIYLYPSTCLFEGTVVSEGRGTVAPFQLIGHPDYSSHKVSFTPQPVIGASLNPKLKGKKCYGIDLRNIPIDSLKKWRSVRLDYLFDFYYDLNLGSEFFIDYFDLLAGTDKLRQQIINGVEIAEIKNSWMEELESFKKIRAKYLLYPDFE